MIYRCEGRLDSLSCLSVGGGQVIVKLFEVALVIPQGVFAEVALVTQVLEKLS